MDDNVIIKAMKNAKLTTLVTMKIRSLIIHELKDALVKLFIQ